MFPLETIVSRAKRRGFVYPNSEIYGGLANMRDYGPYGSQLKKNIYDLRWKYFVTTREDIVALDTTILAHPTTWVASGHVGWFADALVDDKKTGQRFRADKIIETSIAEKSERFGGEASVQEYITKTYGFENLSPEAWWNEGMHRYIVGEKLKNPLTGKDAEWTDVRQFNLMLNTHLGPVADDANKVYMRPETCQSLFTNFRNVCDTTRMRIPFWLAQIGKAFRNEITPGQFLYRTREFEQMEIEYFVQADPTVAKNVYEQWKADSMNYRTTIIGIDVSRLRYRDHDKLAHYAAAATDIEYEFPRWFGEVQWIHNRTDFDLKQHQEYAKTNMQYTDPHTGERYIPRCIEASTGLGRQVMVALLEFYDEEVYTDGNGQEETRVVVRFPTQIAPVKVAIFPLIKKDEQQVTIAENLWKKLSKITSVEYDDGGAIGKRYRRQDEIGTPRCITVDHATVEKGMVTLRERDTMQQITLHTDEVVGWVKEKLGL
jgi:glycyl-tRNA synthetase